MSVVDKNSSDAVAEGHHPLRYADAEETRENHEQLVFVLMGAPGKLALDAGHLDVLTLPTTGRANSSEIDPIWLLGSEKTNRGNRR